MRSLILDPLDWLFEEARAEGIAFLGGTTSGRVRRGVLVGSGRWASCHRCHCYVINIVFNNVIGAVAVLAVSKRQNKRCPRHGNHNRCQNHGLRQGVGDVFAIGCGLTTHYRWGTRGAASLDDDVVDGIADEQDPSSILVMARSSTKYTPAAIMAPEARIIMKQASIYFSRSTSLLRFLLIGLALAEGWALSESGTDFCGGTSVGISISAVPEVSVLGSDVVRAVAAALTRAFR